MRVYCGKLYVTWEDVEKALDEACDYFERKCLKFDGVYAIPRGGLPIGVMFSHRLGIPLLAAPHSQTLIVDDITDSGKTLKAFTGKYFTYTLFYHRRSEVVPDKWSYEKTDNWVKFPWEKGGVE